MDLDGLINLVTNNDYQHIESKIEKISIELTKLGIKSKQQQDFINKILKITRILKNPKTIECYLWSYFRICKNGINTHGRAGSILIEITTKCTKNCSYCYSKYTGQKQFMLDDVLESIICFAGKNFKRVFLTGGEATLDKRVFSIAKKNPDIMFFMFTNGSTMTDEYAKKLSSLGNLIPIVSINGGYEVTHDSLKGKGSYKEVIRAIDLLNKNNVDWGFISLVTEKNAEEVLSKEFIEDKIIKGAFIARYLEYLPVGFSPIEDLILSGETYHLLERRKKEIKNNREIYIQDTSENNCSGLVFFDVNGNIKNCVVFHYAKYNVKNGDIEELVKKSRMDWTSCSWPGECPVYSDPIGFKNQLEKKGWKHLASHDEEYLINPYLFQQLKNNYKDFLALTDQQ